MLRKDITPWESEQHNLFPYATDIVVFIQRLHNKFYIFWASIIWNPRVYEIFTVHFYMRSLEVCVQLRFYPAYLGI